MQKQTEKQPAHFTNISPGNRFSSLPSEILLAIAVYLNLPALAKLSLTCLRLSKLLLEVSWRRVIKSGDPLKLVNFCISGPNYIPTTLAMPFYTRLENDPNQTLLEQARGRVKLLKGVSDETIEIHHCELPMCSPGHFGSTAVYYAYLESNIMDLFIIKDIPEVDEQGQTFISYFGREISVFEVLLNATFNAVNYQKIAQLVAAGASLPLVKKTRQNFDKTSSYFRYLMHNLHDLYISLRDNPDLINLQDENKRTLLFYPVKVARCLPKNHLLWLVQILLSVPNSNLTLVDKDGDTFLHKAVLKLDDISCDNFGIVDQQEDAIFNFIYLSYLEYAAKNNFNFNGLNHEGLAVLHIAARISAHDSKAVFALLQVGSGVKCGGVDAKQLSKAGYSALFYAIKSRNTLGVNILADHYQLTVPELYELLESTVEHVDRIKYSLASGFSYFAIAFNNMVEQRFLRAIYIYFNSVCKKSLGEGVTIKLSIESWLTQRMINQIISSYTKIPSISKEAEHLISVLKLRNKDIITKEVTIFNFLINVDQTTPLHRIIINIYNAEIDKILFRMNANLIRVSEYLSFTLPNTMGWLERQLSLKLSVMAWTDCVMPSKDLIIFFNKLTKDCHILACNELFSFLLSFNEPLSQTTPMWQQSLTKINWQEVIQGIRVNALQVVYESSKGMTHNDAIKFFKMCRELPIFAKPNSIFEKIIGTNALGAIDEWLAMLEAENLAGKRSAKSLSQSWG